MDAHLPREDDVQDAGAGPGDVRATVACYVDVAAARTVVRPVVLARDLFNELLDVQLGTEYVLDLVPDPIDARILVLDNHDGELLPSVNVREQIIRQIRQWNADLVLAPRPNDYHPDHRYTGVLVQDAFDADLPADHLVAAEPDLAHAAAALELAGAVARELRPRRLGGPRDRGVVRHLQRAGRREGRWLLARIGLRIDRDR